MKPLAVDRFEMGSDWWNAKGWPKGLELTEVVATDVVVQELEGLAGRITASPMPVRVLSELGFAFAFVTLLDVPLLSGGLT